MGRCLPAVALSLLSLPLSAQSPSTPPGPAKPGPLPPLPTLAPPAVVLADGDRGARVAEFGLGDGGSAAAATANWPGPTMA